MQILKFLRHKGSSLSKLIAIGLLILTVGFNALAQYQGAPVKKDKLIKALRSKQLQSEDIVAVINSNGVDFRLTEPIRKSLIAAGARPEVIRAIENNQRKNPDGVTYAFNDNIIITIPSNTPPKEDSNYEDLMEKAMNSYEAKKDSANALQYLQKAMSVKPNDAKTYQMMGFVNLYGLNNLEESRKYMRRAITNGGSAVFRVYHDDNGDFSTRCSGSLYISPEKIRFESDDNQHTFETSTNNIQNVKGNTESSKTWKKYPIFNVYMKFGKEKTKFRFAPITGKQEESNMAAYFITESQLNNFKPEEPEIGVAIVQKKLTY